MLHPTRRRRGFSALLLACLLLGLGLPFATAASPSQLQVDVTITADSMTVSGNLSDGRKGIRQTWVQVTLDSQDIGSTRTDVAGNFVQKFDFPSEIPPGDHVIRVKFPGNDRHEATEVAVTASVAGQPETRPSPSAPPASAPASSTAPQPPRPSPPQEASLTLVSEPAEAYPGEVLTLTGRLTSGGRPLGASRISFAIGDVEQPDALVYTDSDGGFSTYLEVPSDLASGDEVVAASFGGTQAFLPAKRVVTVSIKEVAAEDSASPTWSVTASESPSASQPPSSTAVAQTTQPSPPASRGAAFPWSWVMIALLGVGGVATLTIVALLIKRALAPGEGEDGFRLIDDSPPKD